MSNQIASKEIQRISVSNLKFDPDNPRIPNDIDGSNDDEVIEYLLTEANLDDLMKSLVSQGYFEGEPLLVCPSKEDSYIVVEGNRRLGALKLINGFPPPRKQNTIKAILDESTGTIDVVPCIIFNEREEILGYLGYRHITGIKEWDHLAKARYLKQLYTKTTSESENIDLDPIQIYKILAKNIGSKYPSVENLLKGLTVLDFAEDNDIFDAIGKNPNKIHFSLLTTALNASNIRNYVRVEKDKSLHEGNLSSDSVHNLLSWLYGDKDKNKIIGESRDIHKLAKIVGNDGSLDYLLRHQNESDVLETAYSLAGGLMDGFVEGIDKINNTLSSLQDLVTLVSEDLTQHHISSLDNIQKKAKSLHAAAKSFLDDED